MYRSGFRPRRVEGYRWLRSDGTPNFSDHVYRREGSIVKVAKTNLKTASPTTPILELAETMTYNNIRSIPVINSKLELEGLVLATNIVNYIGGGDLYNIVIERHNKNIYSALKEPASTIMIRNPIIAYITDKITSVIEKMILEGIGVVPILDEENRIYGIVTERDFVEYFAGKEEIGVKVLDVMSKNVITIERNSTLKKATETMIKLGFRRLPVVEDDKIIGMITAKDIVKFIGNHEIFKKTISGNIEEALNIPVIEVANKFVYTVNPSVDISQAARYMMEKGISSLLVVEDEKLVGIVTERDILYGILTRGRRE